MLTRKDFLLRLQAQASQLTKELAHHTSNQQWFLATITVKELESTVRLLDKAQCMERV